jgi:hypothetical protein
MNIQNNGHEHEFEPQLGLPEALPAGEKLLWQGSPDVATVARRIFHMRKLVAYFAVLLALRAAQVWSNGGSAMDSIDALFLPGSLVVMGLGAVALLAYLTAKTTVYTLTDKRICMRIGIVLTLTFNLPLRQVQSAALRKQVGSTGDIVIALGSDTRIAWLHLWPHVRPWHVKAPQPMLRAVPDAQAVAVLLSQAWAQANGVTLNTAVSSQAPTSGVRSPAQWQASPT